MSVLTSLEVDHNKFAVPLTEDTVPACMYALQWCTAIIGSGPVASGHQHTAAVIATVVLRVLQDGFSSAKHDDDDDDDDVSSNDDLPTLSWLPSDTDAAQTILWDIDTVRTIVDV